ncbi:tetraacyldisaccharide 4'-kinase [Planctomycetales bacterium]|nr:tetraacyldisaccharide 4'-kinase [Planctomycetales bacterium]GHT03006.1 tetraacyldisaccharide 4'-kinase [Planctomycetales bacterium]
MLNSSFSAVARAWLEGRRGGCGAKILRAAVAPAGYLYGLVGWGRSYLYQHNWYARYRAAAPVVSVGNLTAGGTGKTPFAVWLLQKLIAGGRTPALLLRGYGADAPEQADEALLYRRLIPALKIYAQKDRVASAAAAVADGADILVLDDGFQHQRLLRDVDIVLLDATCPWGGGLPLPAGLLREFPAALARADLVVLTRADQVAPAQLDALQTRLRERLPQTPVLTAEHRPTRLTTLAEKSLPLAVLRGQKVIAVSGIGRPDRFAATLKTLGADLAATVELSDHHQYRAADFIARLTPFSREWLPVVTEKDAVKLAPLLGAEWRERVAALGVDLCLADEAEEIINNLPLTIHN